MSGPVGSGRVLALAWGMNRCLPLRRSALPLPAPPPRKGDLRSRSMRTGMENF